jgi:hypothetical protein
MDRKARIRLFVHLGVILREIADEKTYSGYELGVSQEEYADFRSVVERVHVFNPWFTPEHVRMALRGISDWLTEEKLTEWVEHYAESPVSKRVGMVMAGNIPLVGFHDFLCVLVSGHVAVCKFSSNDNKLWPALISLLTTLDDRISSQIRISPAKLGEVDAIIATGSDNSARYFEHYFSRYPHIIRKNRTSVAVLTGKETDEELRLLGTDIFSYFGLGCRNVSQLLIPQEYDLNRFFGAILPYSDIINHHKYANNFDYHRALYLMNQEELLENGFVLLRFSDQLFTPLSVLNCMRYADERQVADFLAANSDKIQVVVGQEYVPFGQSQSPGLTDYADGVDTMAFLSQLN